MNKYSFIILAIILAICLRQAKGQFAYTHKMESAHQAILDLEFSKFDSITRNCNVEESGVKIWLISYKSFVEYLTSNNSIKSDSTISIIKQGYSDIEKLKNNAFYYYHSVVDLKLMLFYLYFERSDYLKALSSYITSNSLINTYTKKYPQNVTLIKHKLIRETVNELLYSQLGFVRESDSGFITLLNAINDLPDNVAKRESKYLGLFLSEYKKFEKSTKEQQLVTNDYALKGPIEAIISSHIYGKSGNFIEQQFVLEQAINKQYNKKANVLNLLYGSALLNHRNDSAILFLNKFVSVQHNNKFVNYARFKSSMFYFLKNNIHRKDSMINEILSNAESGTEEDKQAIYEAQNSKYWLPELIEARVLFDGGHYDESLVVLLSSKDKIHDYLPQQKLEYSYRIARIYDKKDDLDKASKFYNMVINSGQEYTFYYPSHSAYYLAEMYFENGQSKKAFTYYEKCTKLSSPIYKRSIHRQAELALEKIE